MLILTTLILPIHDHRIKYLYDSNNSVLAYTINRLLYVLQLSNFIPGYKSKKPLHMLRANCALSLTVNDWKQSFIMLGKVRLYIGNKHHKNLGGLTQQIFISSGQ